MRKMTMDGFARLGRSFRLKGAQSDWAAFYRAIYKNNVPFEAYRKDFTLIANALGIEYEKDKIEDFYNFWKKSGYVPLGEDLLKFLLSFAYQDLRDAVDPPLTPQECVKALLIGTSKDTDLAKLSDLVLCMEPEDLVKYLEKSGDSPAFDL